MKRILPSLLALAVLVAASPAFAGLDDNLLTPGKLAFANGEYNLSVQEFKKVTQQRPKLASGFLWLARALGRKAENANPFHAAFMVGDIRDAFEMAVRLDPSNWDARQDLLEFYLEAPSMFGGGVHKARDQARALARMSPAEGFVAESRITEKKKDLVETERLLIAAQKADPTDPGRWRELGLFYHRHKRWAEMEEAFLKAADGKARFYLARGLFDRGEKLDDAQKLLTQFLTAPAPPAGDEPTRSQARLLLGQIDARMGNTADAAREYRAAISENPHFLAAQKELEKLKP